MGGFIVIVKNMWYVYIITKLLYAVEFFFCSTLY